MLARTIRPPSCAAALLAMLAVLAVTAALARRGSPQRWYNVQEVGFAPAVFADEELVVIGRVRPGSIRVWRDGAEHATFLLDCDPTSHHRQPIGVELPCDASSLPLAVHHVGPRPDNFRESEEVAAGGVLTRNERAGSYVLQARSISTRCGLKYRER